MPTPDFVKAKLDKVYTDSVLRKEMSPSSWAGDVSYMPVVRMKMTCGGGMGGSQWYEYIQRESFFSACSFVITAGGNSFSHHPTLVSAAGDHGIIHVKTWDNKDIILNTAYMVKADYFTIATANLYSQNHNFPIGVYAFSYLIPDGHTLTLSNECRPVI